MSIVAMLNLVSVTFSNTDLKDEKNDLILVNVSLESATCSRSSCNTVTFACFNATSDFTHDEVSNPDAKPLNDIDIALSLFG